MDDKSQNDTVPEARLTDVVGGVRADTPTYKEMQKSLKTTGVGDAIIDFVKNPSPLYSLVSFLASDKTGKK